MTDDGISFFQLWDATGRIVANYGEEHNLPVAFQLRPNENFREAGLQNVYRKTDNGSVRLVIEEANPLFQGSAARARACAIYLSLIPKLHQVERSQRQHFDAIIKRFAHNLIKLQTRFKGNFSRLISDTARSRPFSEFQDEVKRRIESNTLMAAQDVCQMSHRAVDLDAQIETLRIISGFADSAAPSSPIRVNLQKTIHRLANPFINELRKKGVEIDVSIPSVVSGEEKVIVIPELFNAAIWQLLDNASKYVLRDTPINISANLDSRPQMLGIVMTSICIDEDELELVFLEGRKGRHSGNRAGSGIGMFIVKKALELMNAKISVHNEGFESNHEGFKYCKHRFVIEFAS